MSKIYSPVEQEAIVKELEPNVILEWIRDTIKDVCEFVSVEEEKDYFVLTEKAICDNEYEKKKAGDLITIHVPKREWYASDNDYTQAVLSLLTHVLFVIYPDMFLKVNKTPEDNNVLIEFNALYSKALDELNRVQNIVN